MDQESRPENQSTRNKTDYLQITRKSYRAPKGSWQFNQKQRQMEAKDKKIERKNNYTPFRTSSGTLQDLNFSSSIHI
jgi:hypothetical protein